MKSIKYIFSVLAVAAIMQSCKNQSEPETKTAEHKAVTEKKLNPDAEYKTASFEIEGMQCAMGCAKVIEKNIAAMDGVKEAEVNFDTKIATISYDTEMVTKDDLIAMVSKTGDAYSVKPEETQEETAE